MSLRGNVQYTAADGAVYNLEQVIIQLEVKRNQNRQLQNQLELVTDAMRKAVDDKKVEIVDLREKLDKCKAQVTTAKLAEALADAAAVEAKALAERRSRELDAVNADRVLSQNMISAAQDMVNSGTVSAKSYNKVRDDGGFYTIVSRKAVCFGCRKVWRRHNNQLPLEKCPQCGKPVSWVNPMSQVPRARNAKAWKRAREIHRGR